MGEQKRRSNRRFVRSETGGTKNDYRRYFTGQLLRGDLTVRARCARDPRAHARPEGLDFDTYYEA